MKKLLALITLFLLLGGYASPVMSGNGGGEGPYPEGGNEYNKGRGHDGESSL